MGVFLSKLKKVVAHFSWISKKVLLAVCWQKISIFHFHIFLTIIEILS